MNEKQYKLSSRMDSEFKHAYLSVETAADGKVKDVIVDGSFSLLDLKTIVDYLEAIEAAADA